jgi:hypothetical protein
MRRQKARSSCEITGILKRQPAADPGRSNPSSISGTL